MLVLFLDLLKILDFAGVPSTWCATSKMIPHDVKPSLKYLVVGRVYATH